MWSNLISSGEAAKSRFASALKETNDALSQRASAHAQQIKISQSSSPSTSPTASTEDRHQNKLKGDAGNENAVYSFPSLGNISPSEKSSNDIFYSLKAGWGNVVEATKSAVETTKDVVEKEQIRIQAALFANGPYVRGTSTHDELVILRLF